MEILPFLYLGSALHASKKEVLDAIGISALLNVSADCPNHFEGDYQYKCIPVEDNHKEDISSWFLEAIEFIGEWRVHVQPFWPISINKMSFLQAAEGFVLPCDESVSKLFRFVLILMTEQLYLSR